VTDMMSQIYLKIEGKYASDDMMESVVEITVDTSLHLPGMFTINLQDPYFDWMDSPLLEIGKAVAISGRAEGSNSQTEIIAKGEITAIEPAFSEDIGASVIIRGYDKSHRLYRSKKTRVFNQMTDGDIVLKVAKECGLQTKVDATGEVHEHVFQVAQSDIDFLQARANHVGYYLYVEDGILNFRREPGGNPKLTLDWGEDLIDFQARLSTAEQVNEVEVHGWDPAQKQAIIGKSATPKNTPKIKDVNHGGDFTKKSFGTKNEEVVNNDSVSTQSEADGLALSILNERCHAFFEAEGVCRGDPALVAGVEVELKGIGKRFSGRYRVTRTVHRYDYSGYKTNFEISGYRANTLGQLLENGDAANPYGLVVGIVTNVNDPDGLARVKVKLPAISDELESNWARLVNPMAGPGRGFEFIPEVNDEVLVAFENDDINKPYILGSLWNGTDKPPEASKDIVASNGKVQKRVIYSRSGHKITIDDSDGKEKISIIDKTGNNSIDIDSSSNQVAINADGDIQLKAKGKILIEGSDITMEAQSGAKLKGASVDLDASGAAKVKGGNVDVKATGQMNIESSATTNVKGGAMLELKAAMVKIN
jgi:phage protein D/phage baseplate assembly protein gpV